MLSLVMQLNLAMRNQPVKKRKKTPPGGRIEQYRAVLEGKGAMTIKQIAAELEIEPRTVREAVQLLEKEGYVASELRRQSMLQIRYVTWGKVCAPVQVDRGELILRFKPLMNDGKFHTVFDLAKATGLTTSGTRLNIAQLVKDGYVEREEYQERGHLRVRFKWIEGK